VTFFNTNIETLSVNEDIPGGNFGNHLLKRPNYFLLLWKKKKKKHTQRKVYYILYGIAVVFI